MMTEEQTIHTAHLDMLRGYLLVLLAYFSRALEENALNNTNRKKQHPGVQTAVSYIKNHYMEHITIEQLALLCFLSQSHLSRLFKEDTGLSITEFIQTVRITKACQLLKSTSLSVSAIAAQVGYQDMHYFNHIFRKIAGCTPGKYRSGTLL